MNKNKTIHSREITLLSMSIFIIGILILISTTHTFTPKTILIKNIDETFQGDYISTCGKITNIKTSTKNTFIIIESEKTSIDSVFFETIKNLTTNSYVCITGKIEIYKGTVEIIGDTITKQ